MVVENLIIRDLYENAITANDAGVDYDNITIRNNEIYNTLGTGECIYFGCQSTNTTYTSCQVHHSIIENNYCHDTCMGGGVTTPSCTGGSMGSGIFFFSNFFFFLNFFFTLKGYQVKMGSYSNIVRNNVCNNTFGPCLLLYDDYNKGVNIIEGNLVLNNNRDSGIQISAGAIIRNNIVVNSNLSGINIPSNSVNLYNGLPNRNLVIEHNTLVSNNEYGIRFGVTPVNTTIRNNAVLGNLLGDFRSVSQSGVLWSRNAYNTGSTPSNVNANGTFLVGTVSSQFASPSSNNFYPLSSGNLVAAGSESGLPYDFNYFARSACAPTGFYYFFIIFIKCYFSNN